MAFGSLRYALFAFAAVGMAACSSKKLNYDEPEGTPAQSDAGTDAVPQDSPENSASASPDNQPLPSVEGSGEFQEYTVVEGDTLMKIAFETYGDLHEWKRVHEANREKISNPNVIPTGTVLKVERPATPVAIDRNGEKYFIRPGDTLGKISGSVYGTPAKWRKIFENNRQLIRDPNKIFAGFHLYYMTNPDDPGSQPPPPQQQEPPPILGGDVPPPESPPPEVPAGELPSEPPPAAEMPPMEGEPARDPAAQ